MDNKTSKQENRSFEVQDKASKGDLPPNTVPQDQIVPTEGETIGGEFPKEVQGMGTNRPSTETQQELDKVREIVASEEDATKTEGAMPTDPILPSVRKRMEELAEQRKKEIAEASRTDADAKGIPTTEGGKNPDSQGKSSDSGGDKPNTSPTNTLSGGEGSETPSKEDMITGNVKAATTAGVEEVDKLEEECQKILKEYGGLEGNIPIHSNYWGMRNSIRALQNKLNNF